MTVTMSTKNQITIPKEIVDVLQLSKGSMLDVRIKGNKIQLIPVEVVEKEYTDEDYAKIDRLVRVEKKKGSAKKVTPHFIDHIK